MSGVIHMSSSATSGRSTGGGYADNPLLRKAAMAVGVVFLLVGILGFVPGITSNYGDMAFAGHTSGAKLLGIFQVSILHNIVHLLFGVAGLAAARTASASRAFLVGGGIIYLVLWIYGLVIGQDSAANFVPVNTADNWLHLLLGIGMIGVGLALSRGTRSSTAATTA
jgi:Domain of unknown function (DUF4383)